MSVRFRPLLALSLLGLAGSVLAVDLPSNLPKRKPGLWEMQMGAAGGQPQMMKLCIDEATDQAMYQMGAQMSGSMCSKFELSVKGNTVIADGVCSVPGPQGNITMTSHSETRFDGDTSYHTDGHIQYSPALMGRSEATVSSGGRWVGSCTAGQKPGDMTLPNGQVMNIKDMGGH
ncbi:DUF3617 domain-containing protein [Dyella subtropica]|uniref:DUF3617 domain-containing protein n=1 Tax=Dyella subtropica TaxID=2992127 RepID=UPI002252A8F2|nr:DUF3617 family protein [Dyella subtropica]